MSDNYLSMLNNPVINPQRPQQTSSPFQTQHIASQSTSVLFPAAQQCQAALQTSAKDLTLVSETDASWQDVLVPWTSDRLPTSRKELDDAGLLIRNTHIDQFNRQGDEENDFKVESIDAFFDRIISNNDKDQYTKLRDQIKMTFGDKVKVYMVGGRVITVIILGLVQGEGEHALVGLQSELVET